MEGRFNRGFFALPGLGGLYLEGLIHGGAYFGNFIVNDLNIISNKRDVCVLSIPNGSRQTSWLFTSVTEELNSGLLRTNPAGS